MMDRKTSQNRVNRLGWSPAQGGTGARIYPPSTADSVNPYESIDEERERRSRHGSGVGYSGPNYHVGSREGLDILGPNLGYGLDRSGSDGDGEEDSPLPHHRPIPLHPHLAAQAAAAQQSLRRSHHSRPPPHYQLPHTENPYQQPYLSRSGSRDRHDSPTSERGSEGTLTDSDLPFANHQQSSAALQNGGLPMNVNLEYLQQTGRGNSLKRSLNSNGKPLGGVHGHGSNHDSLMDQFVMTTPGGKIYIPAGDTPKNSTSDYKTSPGSSPSKKTSGSSLLYRETMPMGTLRGPRQNTKGDDEDFLYKFRSYCPTWFKFIFLLAVLVFLFSLILNILFIIGALPALGNSESPVSGGKVQLPGTEVIESSPSLSEEKGQSILPTHDGVTGNLPISQTGTKSEVQPIGTEELSHRMKKRALSPPSNEIENDVDFVPPLERESMAEELKPGKRDILNFVPVDGVSPWRIETPGIIDEGNEGIYFVVETPTSRPPLDVTDVAISPAEPTRPHGATCECYCPCLNDLDSGEVLDGSGSGSGYIPVAASVAAGQLEGEGSGFGELIDVGQVQTATFDTPPEESPDLMSTTVTYDHPPTTFTTTTPSDESGRSFPPDTSSFAQMAIGTSQKLTIPAYSYWNLQFYQPQNQYILWEVTVPRGASIGLYARRNALPTHTHYDIVQILRGFKTNRNPRISTSSSSAERVILDNQPSKETSHFLEQGHWFVSLYNDDSDGQEVVFALSLSEDMTEGCPNGCTGNGQCTAGRCQCNPGFGSEDCSSSVCPVLCSGRGEYVNGECSCNPGWKGKECELRHDECGVKDCSGHGKCINGKCSCSPGYKGENCLEVDCPHPTCTGHGFCLAGICMCKKGWRGVDCSEPDNEALQCLPDCSSHGTFNLDTQSCVCEPKWTGEDCSKELCDTDCGPNGVCIGRSCQCTEEWSGPLCNQRVCDKRCSDHGQCKNGTCLCVTGWNGKHCTLEGCPNSCSGHGSCKANVEGFWECRCHQAWTGSECSISMEQNCNDGQDNDKDGLTDCEDPECCTQPACEKSQLCVSAKKPRDILLRKQPPAITASFFEKMKFLIEVDSLQSYAKPEAFNGSRSGVVRGRVVTPNGSGLMGVRVSSTSPLEPLGGFTLTQDDGWFDLMVNGGGAVTLQFGRSPFNPKSRTIFVPWNEVVVIDRVVMGTNEEKSTRIQPCDAHDYESMKPVVLATWKHGFQGNCQGSTSSLILPESQVVQERIRIPGTNVHLMYHSSRAEGYKATIKLQLTPETIPGSLRKVILKISIEGVLFEKVFEADPNIQYTFAWNRLNIYRQRVHGIATAIVHVGYEYENCVDTIWTVESTTLSGHDMTITEIGGWNLDIHHRYNFHEGIIQKGDGSNIYLKFRPPVILTTVGNGYQRPLQCGVECNGVGAKSKLLAAVALAPSPDGTLFIGDFNLIRKLNLDGTIKTLVRLNTTRVSYRYHMALSPVDNVLYISDPESHQIIRVRSLNEGESTIEPEHNWEPVVGSGERCLPGDEAHCGDDGLARDAKLAYPKGVAISVDNILYFVDGTNIRKVDRDGIISTLIGNHQHKSHFTPIPCEGSLKVEEVHLRWPTEVAINPLDNSLYIIDDHMILKLTDDNRIRIVAGRSIHCPSPPGGYDSDLATHTSLISPQSLAFAPNGNLYIAESDGQRTSRVRLITTNGRISHFAGAESKCNCLDPGCSCFEEDHYLAATAKFNTISAIAMTPDGSLHISDQGNYRVRTVQALIPSSTAPTDSKVYEVYSPETQEIYVFNRFGQHVATKNIVTGERVYTFLYNVNMSNGKLSSVTDTAENKLQILRDYSFQVKSIENSHAQKFNLRMSRKNMLHEFSTPEGHNITFNYHTESNANGLLKTRQDTSGRSSVYTYDEFGRLVQAISPTGQLLRLEFELSKRGAKVVVSRDEGVPTSLLIKGSSVYERRGKFEQVTSVEPDGSVRIVYPWGQTITTETVPYNILGEINPVLSDSFPVPGKQKMEIGTELVNRVEWRFITRKEGRGRNKQVIQVDKKMRVNGENLLTIEYDRESKSEIIFIGERIPILNVTFDPLGRPLRWVPSFNFAPVDYEYDRFGRLVGWKWGNLNEAFEYDRSGRLANIQHSDGTAFSYIFNDAFTTLPQKMRTGGGSDYFLEYDASGAFESLTTPRGHIHNFGISTFVGHYEFTYKSPSSRDPFRVQFNDYGHITSVLYPSNSGRINYVYTAGGQVEAIIAGLRSIQLVYHEGLGLLKVAEILQSSFESKIEYKYHGGMLKEERAKFGPKSSLANIHLKYQYDGNGRLANVETELNGKSVQSLSIKKNGNTGALESINELRFIEPGLLNPFNRSIATDAANTFIRILEKDPVGRLVKKTLNIRGSPVFRLELIYNELNGRVKERKMTIANSPYVDEVQYTADGQVSEVTGSGNWKYVYDENGNGIQLMEQREKSLLIYDSGDRVIQVGELLRYTYDSRGFLVQRGNEKFQYDDRGQLLQVVKNQGYKIWYSYDHYDRMVSWRDDQGNVTQFIYANAENPKLITHVHFPGTSKTLLCIYDDFETLLSLVSNGPSDGESVRYYVASDQNKSPLALFNVHGTLVKEIHRTPFGKVVRESSAHIYVPIGFYGGIVDGHTGLVFINGRPFDPTIGQWMTPDWLNLPTNLRLPTDVFTYRFRRNDPITPTYLQAASRMNTLRDWLTLYGFHPEKIFGQKYIGPVSFEPKVDSSLGPEFSSTSALECMADTVTSGYLTLGFRQESRLNPERILTSVTETQFLSKLANKKSPFGSGLLLSRLKGGKTLVSAVENSVVQGVLTSVLNGSLFVDFRSTHSSAFHFVKDNPLKLRDDMEELKRLGGYNVSLHEAENGIKELKLSSGDTSITVRYGADVEEELSRLIKHAHRRTIERAWEEERKYISMGLDGRRPWTEEEKEQLIIKGLVHGYRATEFLSVQAFPQLAEDPNNVLFLKDSRRKRRNKSNSLRRRH